MKHLTIAAALFLVACGSSEDGGNNSSEGAEGGAAVEQTPANLQDDPNNSVVPLTTPNAAPTPTPSPIAALPAGFQGRWGLVPNDCVERDDGKGLMTVTADTLAFYESRARIERAAVVRPETIRLDLAFSGEGQNWKRQTTLTRLDGGRTLIAETPADPEPPMRNLRYMRCPA